MVLSIFYGTPASDEERFKVFDRVIQLGSTYIDTADMYGDSEDLLGKYFKKYPQQCRQVIISISIKRQEHPFSSLIGTSHNEICQSFWAW